jgi:branched-chain amino acid transport system substrate-binding protein
MKIKIILGIIIVILIILVAAFYKPVPKETIKIGAILPLSGGAAAYGEQVKNGIDLALEKNPNSRINLVYEDSQCDSKESVSAYNKLVAIDGIKIIIGDFCSSSTLSITPLAEKDHVILITPGAAAEKITNGGYVFRNHVLITQKTGLLATAASTKFKKAAIIFNSANDVFVESSNVFKNIYNNVNGDEIVSVESFKTSDTDFRTQLLRMKSQKPEAIYIGSIMPETALIVKQMKELNIEAQILTDDSVLDPNFLKVTSDLSEGIIFGTTKFGKESAPDFWKDYYDSFGKEPTIFSAQGYDTLNILLSVIRDKCLSGDPTCIKDQLYKTKDYPGVSGKTSFNEKGDAIKEVVLKIIKNGQFVPYSE